MPEKAHRMQQSGPGGAAFVTPLLHLTYIVHSLPRPAHPNLQAHNLTVRLKPSPLPTALLPLPSPEAGRGRA